MSSCSHSNWRRTASADAWLIRFVCTACRAPFYLPILWTKPRMRVVKEAMRVARGLQTLPGPRGYFQVPCPARDVPYLLGFLTHAGFHCEVPEYAASLLVRGGSRAVRAAEPPR